MDFEAWTLYSCIQYVYNSCLTEAPVGPVGPVGPADPVLLTLAVFSAVCVAVICAEAILIHKLRKSKHCAGGKCSLWDEAEHFDRKKIENSDNTN